MVFENEKKTKKLPFKQNYQSFEINYCFCGTCCKRGIFKFRKIPTEKALRSSIVTLYALSMFQISTTVHKIVWFIIFVHEYGSSFSTLNFSTCTLEINFQTSQISKCVW